LRKDHNLNRITEGMCCMRRTSYLKRAAKRFLDGTRMKTPVEAVEAGVCSLQDWVRVLAEEREIEQQYQLEHHLRRAKSPSHTEHNRSEHNRTERKLKERGHSENAVFKGKLQVNQGRLELEA
jgi:hypothetical protein